MVELERRWCELTSGTPGLEGASGLWAAVDGGDVFSGFKQLFGEVVMAKKFARMVAEIELKAWVYTLMMNLPPAPALSAVRS